MSNSKQRPATVRPAEWRPTKFCDRQWGSKGDRTTVAELRQEKLEECHPTFIDDILTHGFRKPVGIRIEKNGHTSLHEGHHRWFIAEKYDLEIPVFWYRYDDDDVRLSDNTSDRRHINSAGGVDNPD